MKKYFSLLLINVLFATFAFSQPAIRSFSPQSGPAGSSVTIKGTGFSTIASNNIVFFGAVKAIVSASTDTTLTVTVPAGATYGPFTVTVGNLTAYSPSIFVVTFTNSETSFSSTSFLPKSDFVSGLYPHSVYLADFNLDGKADMLVSRGSSDKVSVFTNTSSNNTISFSAGIEFNAQGFNHEGAAVGDLDGDGKIDFILTNSNNIHSISVFRNTTTGNAISFATKIDYAVDNAPYFLAIGDLDNDGKPDLAVANAGSDKISIFRNTSIPGTISFEARTDLFCGASPFSIVISDIDNDGKRDLVFTNQGGISGLSIMKNSSTGNSISFEAPQVYANFATPFVVAVGDLDGDDKADIVASSGAANNVIVKKNISSPGTISFSGLQNSYTTGRYPEAVSITDMNGDGKADLVTANWMAASVSVLKNTSENGNISFADHVDYAVAENPTYVTGGDLDGDGRPDIAAANSSSNAVSVLRNIIGANIAPVITLFSPANGINGTTVVIKGKNFSSVNSVQFGGIDASSFTVNADTVITAVVGSGASGNVSVTTATGTATLAGFSYDGPIITSFTPAVGVTGTSVTISGVNFTGVNSVQFGGIPAASFTIISPTSITAVLGNGASGNVSVTTPNGTATLAGFSYGAPTITSFSPLSAPIGATVTITGTNFSSIPTDNIVYFGAVKATVSSASSTQLTVTVPGGATYQPITVTTNNLTAYSSLFFSTNFASDNTTISANTFTPVGNYGSGMYPFAITICDLNDDGKPDLLTANSQGNSMSVLKNTSTSSSVSFAQKIDFATGADAKRIVTGDLDGDGKPDIVVCNFNAGNASTISIFRNTSSGGNISFAAKQDYSTGNGSIGLKIADMNGDGKPDIIITSGNSGFFSIFQNTTASIGNISFATKKDYTLLAHPDELIIADLNNDGKPDLVTSNFSDANISVYRNISSGGVLSLDARINFSIGMFPSYINIGDFNNDGKLDIVIKNSTTLSILKNTGTNGSISLANAQNYNLETTNISVSDLNGDGKADLCTGRTITGMISVLENLSDLSTISFANNIDFSTGSYDTFTAAGDLDGDGKPEIAVANTTLFTITILKNKISGPEISALSALSAKKDETITITGNNFTGTTSVKFGGTPAKSFNVISSTKIDAIANGGSSGNITVTTPSGVASFPGFNFIPEVTANGPTNFCNEGAVLLSSSAIANNQWYKDGLAINGATSTTYQAVTGGTYAVKTTANGITTTSASGITVTVITVPTPVITNNGTSLLSSATSGNQWYFNGTAIQGATGQTHQPTQSGNYSVQSTVNGCTSSLSANFNFIVTGIINLGNDQFIRLYPNPVKNKLTIDWSINNVTSLNVQITNLQGKMLLKKIIQPSSAIDLSNLPAGMYIIKITSSQKTINETAKIIRTN